jgi:hypothetical protein
MASEQICGGVPLWAPLLSQVEWEVEGAPHRGTPLQSVSFCPLSH